MKLIDMLNNIDTLLLSNSTNESHYKVALEEVSKLLENIQEQGDEDLSNFLWKLKTILIIKDRANSNMRCDSFKSHMIINKLSKFL